MVTMPTFKYNKSIIMIIGPLFTDHAKYMRRFTFKFMIDEETLEIQNVFHHHQLFANLKGLYPSIAVLHG